jgi:hypothetical protein
MKIYEMILVLAVTCLIINCKDGSQDNSVSGIDLTSLISSGELSSSDAQVMENSSSTISITGINVIGEWIEDLNRESMYLEINEDSSGFYGLACERKGQDCMDLENININSDVISFRYRFGVDSVSADLSYLDGKLIGTYLSSKASGPINVIFIPYSN